MSSARLSEIIARAPLAGDRLLDAGATLAGMLAEAHATGVTFGALGASSVCLSEHGEVSILDAAMAPISGRRQDDLLALGVLLYAMATGAAAYGPPRGGGAPPSPIEINPRLPSGLVQVLRRAVHPDPTQRFAAAAELADALREVRRAPGSLESLLPAEHVSSSAAVKPPPRPAPGLEELDDEDPPDDDAETEPSRGLPVPR